MSHGASAPDRLLAAVAAHDLPGAVVALPDAPLDDSSWQSFVDGALAQRLAGHLAAAVQTGAFATTSDQTKLVGELHAQAMGLAVVLEDLLLRVLAILDDHGFDHRVLKGPALAHSIYPEPSVRSFGDVDLLLPASQLDEAVRALRAAGWRRPQPELRPGFDRRFGKGATLVDGSGHQLDVHRTLAQGPFGLLIELEDLFTAPAEVRIGGRDVRVLPRETAFVHACYHAALGSARPRLVPLRDVAQFLLAGTLDEERVRELARRWRGEVVVAQAIRTAWQRFQIADTVPLSVWAGGYVGSPAEQRALASYRRVDHPYGAKAIAALRVIPGAAAKAAYAQALLWPSRESIAHHRGGYRSWWARGTRALLGRRAGVRKAN